ncbi:MULTISPECIES: phosphoglycolate phosphatase [Oleiagrimonas]|uniref:phosphoglycolate phosphatase n=1 Tax=Oleiagrimonas citrea TaxID=1665687 RepID=A0A846ZH32_9GAMM|nr:MULTISPECIES: phosphoglycolate phosphatase [Oleiagrimonas]NKZ37706.1 phosphoglycolate phosphatase [Oleiagrimonas citrea]RAP56366.1 phosphoglycolate phosphatase [Oleiagrimonas sp. MCCC 1A03011]
MKTLPESLSGVLFDLDGTVLDSAPDLFAALCELCAEKSFPLPDYAPVRQVVSRGGRAILKAGIQELDEDQVEALLPRFLACYAERMGTDSPPFPGVSALLEALEADEVPWGIVTNKAGFLTDPLLERVGLASRAAAVVCGDTLPVRKPDPAPVLLACEQAGMEPSRAVFVGDDERDVQAGRAAGLFTVAVAWGYLDGGDPHAWGADAVVEDAAALQALLRLKVSA